MKSAIICFVCKKLKKFSETYAVKIVDYGNEPVVLDSSKNKYDYQQRKVRVCRTDIRRMGYKVRSKMKGGEVNASR